MRSIILVILLCTGSFFGSCVLKKKFEEILPFTLIGIIFVLYPFYIINKLKAGYVILIIVCIILYIISIVYIIRKKDLIASFKRFFTPGMATFGIILLAIYVLTRGRYVILWDELRLWAAVPKALFCTDTLQFGKDAIIYKQMQYYPPALALLQYFWFKTLGVFAESQLFFVYAMLVASLFMPMLKKMSNKYIWFAPVIAFFIIILPLTLNNNGNDDLNVYYASLFIDPALGVFLAFGLYLAYKNPIKNISSTIGFIITLSTIMLLKNSGVIFVIIILIAAFVFYKINKKETPINPENKNKGLKRYSDYLRFVFCILIPILYYVSWNHLCNKYGVQNELANPINAHNIIGFISNPTEHQILVLKAFLVTLVKGSIVIQSPFWGVGPLDRNHTYLGIMVLITLITMAFGFSIPKEKRKKYYILQLFAYIVNCIFILGLLLLYVFCFNTDLPSFQRYTSTVLLMHLALLLMVYLLIAFEEGLTEKIKTRQRAFAAIVGIILVAFFPIHTPNPTDGMSATNHFNALKSEKIILSQADNKKRVNMFLIMNGEIYADSQFHHSLYFDLIDNNIFIKNYYPETNYIGDNTYPAVMNQRVIDFKKQLINEDITYIYITRDNEIFNQYYGKLFSEPIQKDKLYRVTEYKGKILIKPAK